MTWWSHPEDAEARRLDRCIQGGGEGEAEDAARVYRVDDAVVPETRGGVVGMALGFVLGADWRFERFLLLRRRFAAAHLRQHHRGLLAAHHRDARVRPHEQETRVVGAAAHAVVAGTVAAADDEG